MFDRDVPGMMLMGFVAVVCSNLLAAGVTGAVSDGTYPWYPVAISFGAYGILCSAVAAWAFWRDR